MITTWKTVNKIWSRLFCTIIYIHAFTTIYGYTEYSFKSINKIIRRMCLILKSDILKCQNKTDKQIEHKTKNKRLSERK